MSRYYPTYTQYLGAQRCCDSRGPGPVGPVGPTGPASIGPLGNTGPTGESVTGPTGRSCRGPTGEPGPTGNTGPTGINIVGSAGCYGDYLYWDTSNNSWTVGSDNINIGCGAGETSQGTNAVAIGLNAGNNAQNSGAVAIGLNAGQGTTTGQGANAIAIGNNAGVASQTAGSICLNASGVALNPGAIGCFINPIRTGVLGSGLSPPLPPNSLYYDPVSFEILRTT
jgi:hypothetical protein